MTFRCPHLTTTGNGVTTIQFLEQDSILATNPKALLTEHLVAEISATNHTLYKVSYTITNAAAIYCTVGMMGTQAGFLFSLVCRSLGR